MSGVLCSHRISVKESSYSRRSLALVSLLLVSANLNSIAQTQPMMVFWDENPSCGLSNVEFDRKTIKCLNRSNDHLRFQTFKHGGVTVSAAFIHRDEWVKAIIRVTNDKTSDIRVDVTLWNAVSFSTPDSFRAGEKPLRTSRATVPIKTFSRPPSPLEREAPERSMSTNPTSAPVTDVGRATSTTVPGTTMKQDQPITPSKPANMWYSLDYENQSALLWNVIPAKKEFSGAVSFATVRDAAFRVIALDINSTVYVFPVTNTAK